jgi:hypothetical protein
MLLMNIAAAITVGCALLLILNVGISRLLLFFLFFVLIAAGSYFTYRKFHPKAGFIGMTFCLVFMVFFVYLELYVLNFW